MNDPVPPAAWKRRWPAIAFAAWLSSACADASLVPAARPDVVLITVDTLRADRLSSYGYSRPTTPHIDSLAADSVLFTNAITPRSATAPSLASTFTGLYPYKHGVVTNFVQVHDSLWTLPEILKDAGYATAAFVSNYVLIRELSGFHQGFDVYDDFIVEREPNRAVYERKAEDTVDAALAWLEKGSEQPFFLWLHLIDPHGPYRPPPPYEKKFGPSPVQRLARASIPDYQRVAGSKDASFYLDRYDGEIAYTDAEIGRLLDALRARGSYDDALVIFHADHGESLGEHGIWFEHGTYIYEACNRIPLLLKLPGDSAHARKPKTQPGTSDRLVSVMDITPTVVDVLELEAVDALDEMDGESLLSVLEKGRQAEPFIFVDTLGMPRYLQYAGLRSENAKLVLRLDPKKQLAVMKRQFYRLDDDRLEAHNLSPSKDPAEKEMARRLKNWMKRVQSYELPFETTKWRPPDGDAFIKDRKAGTHVEELRALGYVE